MRRADRLFQIYYGAVGCSRWHRKLAEQLEVMARLSRRGDLIRSTCQSREAGVGYVMQAGYDLPLMFNSDEISSHWWQRQNDPRGAARRKCATAEALVKIEAVTSRRTRASSVPVHAFQMSDMTGSHPH
jgi:predicted DNA-binding transcriptional regulator YafY